MAGNQNSGRPRKLREQKMLENTYRADRDKPTFNGEVISKLPQAVEVPLSDKAFSYYKGVGNRLIAMGVLNDSDLPELELMAYEFGTFWEHEEKRIKLESQIEALGDDIDIAVQNMESKETIRELKDKYKRKHEELRHSMRQRNLSLNKATSMSSKFGMNPIDRQKLAVSAPDVELDPFADL